MSYSTYMVKKTKKNTKKKSKNTNNKELNNKIKWLDKLIYYSLKQIKNDSSIQDGIFRDQANRLQAELFKLKGNQ